VRVKFIVPFPLDADGVKLRRAQLPSDLVRPGDTVDFVPAKNAGAWLDSEYDSVLADLLIFEAGLKAEEEGYDAVCIDTMSDSGLHALRSRLKIPVVAPAVASFHLACMLGHKFTVITMWDRWVYLYKKHLNEYHLGERCASLRHINEKPDLSELLTGKEETFRKLEAEAWKAIRDDGADVIILGSTTMHQSQRYLSERLPVPVLNPGLVAYKVAQLLVELKLAHSKTAYPLPQKLKDELIVALGQTASKFPWP
jgi:allantoin racemase